MKSIESEFPEKADISEAIATGELVAFNCTHDKEIILAVAQNPSDYRTFNKSGVSFVKARTQKGQNHSIFYTVNNNLIYLTNIKNEPLNIHKIQFLTNNKILLVCCRSYYYGKDKYDFNGRIYSVSGEHQKSILLGDGISSVQITKKGTIWTSYSDEGVFGNYGCGSNPIGANGLVAWNAEGKKVYQYYWSKDVGKICDCYALNVETENITWCYYYTKFPLVKIKKGSIVDYWHIPIYGSDCFAIFRNFALFRGGYGDRDYFYLVKLGKNHQTTIEKKIQPVNIKNIERICSRGDTIFCLFDKKIYSISVHEAMYSHSN